MYSYVRWNGHSIFGIFTIYLLTPRPPKTQGACALERDILWLRKVFDIESGGYQPAESDKHATYLLNQRLDYGVGK
jgi:hypothetical protein